MYQINYIALDGVEYGCSLDENGAIRLGFLHGTGWVFLPLEARWDRTRHRIVDVVDKNPGQFSTVRPDRETLVVLSALLNAHLQTLQ